MKIGILRETLKDDDPRVAITPFYVQKILQNYPHLKFKIQASEIRAFSNNDYQNAGAKLDENLMDCDYIFGVKEVDPETLYPNKNYFFFAHVAKAQEEHRAYFKQLASKKINLIDYEYLTDSNGHRVASFGYWAGIIGVYNAFQAYGLKNNLFNIPLALDVHNYEQMLVILKKISLPNLKFIITGTGSTARGVCETLLNLGIHEIQPSSFYTNFHHAAFCQLSSKDYIENRCDHSFSKQHYYQNPEKYRSYFNDYAKEADIYFACHFWESPFPAYLSKNDLKLTSSKMKIIIDISCDLHGPIASTLRETTLSEPYYDYNPNIETEEAPFNSPLNISVCSVANLPAALPLDASEYFSKSLYDNVLPSILINKNENFIKRATILNKGKLTSHFSYLYNFLTK